MRIVKGASLELHELQEEHLPVLYAWRNSEDFRRLCSTRRSVVSFPEFREELLRDLHTDRHEQFMIVRKGECVGTIYSYKFNGTDGYVFVTTFLDSRSRTKGYGAEAFVIFLDFLFVEYKLYKVYVEVYSYNKESLQAISHSGFVEEGRFHGHRVYGGERFDLIRFAFFRENIAKYKKILERLTGGKPNASLVTERG